MRNPFRNCNSSPEVIRLTVMMYIRYPLSLRQVEDLLGEPGALFMPIDRRAGVGHQLVGIEVGRLPAMEDRQGDVGREEAEPQHPGALLERRNVDEGGQHSTIMCPPQSSEARPD